MSGIGLLNEKPLHASLKEWYAQPGDRLEIAVDGFVIDIVRKNLLLEIQTANFVSVKKKMNNLALSHRIRLIYPLAREKWIVKLPKDASGEVTRRRSAREDGLSRSGGCLVWWSRDCMRSRRIGWSFFPRIWRRLPRAIWRMRSASGGSWRRRWFIVCEKVG